MNLLLSVIFFAFLAILSQIFAAAIDFHLYARLPSGKHFFISFEKGNEFTFAKTGDPASGVGFEKGRVARIVIDKAWIASNLVSLGSVCNNRTIYDVEQRVPVADRIDPSVTYSLVYNTVNAATK